MEELAGLGATVYTCGRDVKTLDSILTTWRHAGLKVEGSICDLSDRKSREELFRRVSAKFGGKLNILVRIYSYIT